MPREPRPRRKAPYILVSGEGRSRNWWEDLPLETPRWVIEELRKKLRKEGVSP